MIFRRVVFQLLQAEENVFNYFMLADQFVDPHSWRFDEPSFTNIAPGQGLFGAYTLDSTTVVLPDGFVDNRQ